VQEQALHIVLTIFALLFPLLLAPVYSRFSQLRREYLTTGETPSFWPATAQAFHEFNALVFVVPVLIAMAFLLQRPLPSLSDWSLPLIGLSLLQYLTVAVLAEYYKLYDQSKRKFSTGLVMVPIMLVCSFVLIILVPMVSALCAFTPDAGTANVFGWLVLTPLAAYILLGVSCVAIPMERDARFIKKCMAASPLLGEILAYVDDMVHNSSTNSERLKAIAGHLSGRFHAALPRNEGEKVRLLEFVIYTSMNREVLAETVTLEICRRAAVYRLRLIARIQTGSVLEEFDVDIGGIRRRRLACVVSPCDPKYTGPPALRCLDVGELKDIRFSGQKSCITFGLGSKLAQQFWDDAVAAEADYASRSRRKSS